MTGPGKLATIFSTSRMRSPPAMPSGHRIVGARTLRRHRTETVGPATLRLPQAEDPARAFGAGHGQTGRIEETKLHQHAGLIPIDVLVGNPAVLEADDDGEGDLHALAGWRDAGQEPVDR